MIPLAKETLVYDIEADELLRKVTTIFLIVARCYETGEVFIYRKNDREDTIAEGVARLCQADLLVAHNGCGYDGPVIEKFFPEAKLPPCVDTLLVSKIMYPDIKNHPLGGNSLRHWGLYLKCPKAEAPADLLAGWSQEAEDYCVQDVMVGTKIYQHQRKRAGKFKQAIILEAGVAKILVRQMLNGVGFDEDVALKLQCQLTVEKVMIEAELQEVFPPAYEEMKSPQYWSGVLGGKYPTKKAAKAAGLSTKEVAALVRGPNKVKVHPFNPASRAQITDRLMVKYNWKPKKKTEHGTPVMDEAVLKSLIYPEARKLERFLLIAKRDSQLKGWLAAIDPNTKRIHGNVNQIGCVTSRMSHSGPNLAQVPAVYSPFGKECRSCFIPRAGWWQVGADSAGIELRALGHELARWDDGEYIKLVLESDIHTHNMKAAGLLTRDQSKTFIYAFLYGGQPMTLGLGAMNHTSLSDEQKEWYKSQGSPYAMGEALMNQFLKNIPALAQLRKWVAFRTKKYGRLVGLDGRPLPIRSEHMALNTLLQSHGAIIQKKALVLLDEYLQTLYNYTPGVHYEFMLNIHDEWQLEACSEDVAKQVGEVAVDSIVAAGEALGFRCPLDGEYKIGRNWAETH